MVLELCFVNKGHESIFQAACYVSEVREEQRNPYGLGPVGKERGGTEMVECPYAAFSNLSRVVYNRSTARFTRNA